MAETMQRSFDKRISRPRLPLISLGLSMRRGLASELRVTDTDETSVLEKRLVAPVTHYKGSDTIHLFPRGKEEWDPRFENVEFEVRVFDPRQVPVAWPVADIMFGDKDVRVLNKRNQVLDTRKPERKFEPVAEGADRIRLIFTTFTLRAATGFGDNLTGARQLSYDSAVMLASMPLEEPAAMPATVD